jgi:hypothetical protein
MEKERTQSKLGSKDLYQIFIKTWKEFRPKAWSLAIFEGSPENGLYSWCPDCVVASSYITRFESSLKKKQNNTVRFLKFHVGSRKEWKSKNPFRAGFPHLSDLPTAILFFERRDVFRIIAPQEQDLRGMIRRIRVYEEQIKNDDWHPAEQRRA